MSDLLVVGGGPAGLATALYAARVGLTVTVRERRLGPLDKACGEGLMPGALAALGGLGVDPPGVEIAGIRYVAGERSAETAFSFGSGRGVRRTALHGAMRAAADRAGVVVQHTAVRDLRPAAGGVEVDGRLYPYVVAADGLHSPVRRRLGLDVPVRGPRRHGLRAHFRVAPWTAYVEVHWAGDAEAYVTPVAPDLVGVAVLTTGRGGFEELLGRFPGLRDRLGGASRVGEVMGAGPLRQRARRRVAGRVLLVGDAAGYVDALTGEGVAVALAEARAAVAAILAGDVERYERDWRLLTRRYRLLTHTLLTATQVPPARRLLVPAAQRLPSVFGAAVDALAGG